MEAGGSDELFSSAGAEGRSLEPPCRLVRDEGRGRSYGEWGEA